MRKLTLALIRLGAVISIYGCAFWVVISFIIFLAKDQPFDWDSVSFMGISIVAFIVLSFFYHISDTKVPDKNPGNYILE